MMQSVVVADAGIDVTSSGHGVVGSGHGSVVVGGAVSVSHGVLVFQCCIAMYDVVSHGSVVVGGGSVAVVVPFIMDQLVSSGHGVVGSGQGSVVAVSSGQGVVVADSSGHGVVVVGGAVSSGHGSVTYTVTSTVMVDTTALGVGQSSAILACPHFSLRAYSPSATAAAAFSSLISCFYTQLEPYARTHTHGRIYIPSNGRRADAAPPAPFPKGQKPPSATDAWSNAKLSKHSIKKRRCNEGREDDDGQ